jgi:hypothetical protein
MGAVGTDQEEEEGLEVEVEKEEKYLVQNEATTVVARWHGQPRWRQTVTKPCQATHTTREGGKHPEVARRSRSTEITMDPSAIASVTHAHERSRTKSSDLHGRVDVSSCAKSIEHHSMP